MSTSVFNEAELRNHGAKDQHIFELWRHVIRHEGAAPHEVPGLPAKLYPVLRCNFKALTSNVAARSTSADGSTTKLLVSLQSGEHVEAVIMRYDSRNGRYAGAQRSGGCRATLCISSQVGCKMACSFCATGTMGFKANLSAAEIVEQLVHASRLAPIRNVVFMGMGEPLNNYANVLQAVKIFTGRCFGLAQSRITISTVGVVPRMRNLASDLPGVNLALSLHAPTQELRREIVGSAKAYSLDKLMAALDCYYATTGRVVFVEYVMLAGVNDSQDKAHELGQLLQGRQVVLNLIPYNATTTLGGATFCPSPQSDRRWDRTLLAPAVSSSSPSSLQYSTLKIVITAPNNAPLLD